MAQSQFSFYCGSSFIVGYIKQQWEFSGLSKKNKRSLLRTCFKCRFLRSHSDLRNQNGSEAQEFAIIEPSPALLYPSPPQDPKSRGPQNM